MRSSIWPPALAVRTVALPTAKGGLSLMRPSSPPWAMQQMLLG